jgi:hypothetical protein
MQLDVFNNLEARPAQSIAMSLSMVAPAARYTYAPIDSAGGEIRLLVLLLPPRNQNNTDAPISCRLEKCNLSSHPEYDALSYTWGTAPGKCEDILVDGAPLRLRERAAAALRRLRPASTTCSQPTRIWIDAVCINQQDGAEKAQQILLMTRVYRQAIRACVWLAPSPEGGELMRHPCWDRVWVVLEAVGAKRLTLLCGSDQERVWESVERTRKRKERLGDIKYEGHPFPLINGFRQTMAGTAWNPSTYAILYGFRRLGCADPRDKIYGLPGLAPTLDGFGISPNYDDSVTAASLYADLVRKAIQSTGSLEILNCVREWRHVAIAARTDETMDMASLPSWAPNWTAITSHDPAPLLGWLEPASTAAPARYKAATLMKASLGKGSGDSSQLILGGVRFDEVMELGIPWHPDAGTEDGSPISRNGAKALEHWEDVALALRPLCPYGGETEPERRKEALLRTYIADFAGEGDRAPQERLWTYVESWCDRVGWASSSAPSSSSVSPLACRAESELQSNPRWAQHTRELMTRARPTASRNPLHIARDSLELARHGTAEYLAYARRIYTACCHRRLLVTKRGYFGLAPWNAQVGDVVAALHGGETPFLLRPGSEPGAYSFVGECFVHGVMGGEALAWENAIAAARDFRIV